MSTVIDTLLEKIDTIDLNSSRESIDREIDAIEEKVLQDEDDLFIYLTKTFFDGTQDISVRSRALEELWDRNEDACLEIVNKVCLMYSFSPIYTTGELLLYIVKHSFINNSIKNECAKALYNQNKDRGYECFLSISKKMKDLPKPLQIDIIRYLMETQIYFTETNNLLYTFITDTSIECEYRYKTLLSIQNDSERLFLQEYLYHAYISFIRDSHTYTRYKILGSQYILQNKQVDISIKDEVERICIGFALDSELDYNLRADAADLLVRHGNESSKSVGREIITLLGKNPDGFTTVYSNRQNVHDEKIDESIHRMILYFSSVRTKTINGQYITFEIIQKEIETLCPPCLVEKVQSSLLRIRIDQSIYEGTQTLHSILLKVWQTICDHENSDSLKMRLIDELYDMADTCSSGHISRIMNVFSGFEVDGSMFSIDIGWKKQIQSNLIARLNSRIKLVDDVDIQEKILDEMMTSGNLSTKPHLSDFFRKHLLSIRSELLIEFIEYIPEDEFEEYFRNAISFFEEGS